MNESAPATLQPRVPWWERLVAGVVALVWVEWFVVWDDGWARWWERIQYRLSGIVDIWQQSIEIGIVQAFAHPGSALFAAGLEQSCALGAELAFLGLIGAGCWVAAARGGRRLRCVFWFSLLGVGVLGLGSMAAEGRGQYLFRNFGDITQYSPPEWHGGWLSCLLDPIPRRSPKVLITYSLSIFVGLLMLGLSRRRKSSGTAEGKPA